MTGCFVFTIDEAGAVCTVSDPLSVGFFSFTIADAGVVWTVMLPDNDGFFWCTIVLAGVVCTVMLPLIVAVSSSSMERINAIPLVAAPAVAVFVPVAPADAWIWSFADAPDVASLFVSPVGGVHVVVAVLS